MSQIGFILVGIAMAGLLGEEGTTAARGVVLYMMNHSLYKLLLFMAAGAVYMNLHQLDLNDIRGLHVTEAHVLTALDAAGEDFSLGAVGAGRGMSCYQLKGGIGSASITLPEGVTVGAVVAVNAVGDVYHPETGEVVVNYLNFGNFLSSIITFIILALVIFFMIKGMNRLRARAKKNAEEAPEEPAGPTSEELLTEIRDLLADKGEKKSE